jgi:hypothetical protein
MDEQTLERNAGFARLETDLAHLTATLAGAIRERVSSLPA